MRCPTMRSRTGSTLSCAAATPRPWSNDMSLLLTASQTLGPFGAISFVQTQIADVAWPGVGGERVIIRGRALDDDGNSVNDSMVESWQANAHGKYAHPYVQQAKRLDVKFKG